MKVAGLQFNPTSPKQEKTTQPPPKMKVDNRGQWDVNSFANHSFFLCLCFSGPILTIEWKYETVIFQHITVQINLSI